MEISNVGTIEVDFMPTGLKGDDGITPTIGENGNWFLGDIDTGKPSRGEKGEAGSIKFIVLPQLPTENIDKSAIYMIPSSEQTQENKYDEYVFTDNGWEVLGSAQVKVDLSNYLKKDGLLSETGTSTDNTMSQDAITKELEKKQNTLSAGNNITIENNVISATDTTYENATTETNGLMSSEDKSKLDGLNNYSLPIASAETLGGVKIGENLNIDENGVVSASGDVPMYVWDGTSVSSSDERLPMFQEIYNKFLNNEPFLLLLKYRNNYFPLNFVSSNRLASYEIVDIGKTYLTMYENSTTYYVSNNTITTIDSITNRSTLMLGEYRGTSWGKGALSTTNTIAYNPTANYHPATKKYVDDKLSKLSGYDATKTQVLKNVNGTLTWVDEA